MTKRSIILYWLLLLVPTLIIGAAAFRWLSHEQDWIDQQILSSAMERARAIAENAQLSVITVEEGILEALSQIHSSNIAEKLKEWERNNPLVRNVFIWMPRANLQLPNPKEPTTSEERRFIARYDSLFSGRIPWPLSKAEIETQGSVTSETQQMADGRMELRKLTRLGVSQTERKIAERSKESHVKSGWIPWFSENQLFLLGWIRRGPGRPIYGVEIEMMSLLSRLVSAMPPTVPEGVVYGLLDGNGQLLHQSGSSLLKKDANPDLTVSLAPSLPHWQVAVYLSGDGVFTGHGGRGFMVLYGLLLAIFLATIIFGGSLLLWQAHRNMRDARQKTTFVSNVSHELKTPLTSIRLYAELLNKGRIKDPKKRKNYQQVIVSETQRLTRLVNNVLDFSRLEQGRKKYSVEKLDISEFLRDVLERQRLRIQEVGMNLEFMPLEDRLVIETDRDALEQVILNLIDNAVKYASGHEGGEVIVELRPHPDRCEIWIMDRGSGVSPAHRERIFEKFHRVDDSLTAQQPGAGLGLSIARRLLRDLGGDLVYEPRKGGGSCFVVTIAYEEQRA